jgi:nucleotide-binding universal stress UspA family protein
VTIEVERILVATDFSPEARTAMKFAIVLAGKCGASLHVLHVLEVIAGAEPLTWNIASRKAIEQRIEAAAWEELGRLLSAEERTRFRAELALEWGSPFAEIVRYAQDRDIDVIAMGRHGRGGVKHLIIGSVAENVVRHAHCTVLTVPHARPEPVHP